MNPIRAHVVLILITLILTTLAVATGSEQINGGASDISIGYEEHANTSSGNTSIGSTEGTEIKTTDLKQKPTIRGYIDSLTTWFKNWV